MPFVPVPDVAMVEMLYSTNGGVAENTLYFHSEIPLEVEQLENIALMVKGWWLASLADCQSNEVALRQIKVTSLDSAIAPIWEESTGLPSAGNVGQAALPSNSTLAVTFLTLNRGRSYRGRNYAIGIPVTSQDGDEVTGAFQILIEGAYTDLIEEADGEGLSWVVVSRYSGVDEDKKPIPRVTGVATPVVSVRANIVLDSQRRRLKTRGI